MSSAEPMGSKQPQWYKDAIIYELHVRSFCDSNGDGVGDFRGLTEKLDYLQSLGITALWLLPFYPSPMKDDGYDIVDYTGIHQTYGSMDDFKVFIDEAHRRDMWVIIELVCNHTSDQHPWFQQARQAPPDSPARNFYVWSETPQKYEAARVIFKDFESSNWAWDSVAKAYYWHRFYSYQPDLNYDNPAVHEAIREVVDFWLEQSVDGLRLVAVPYLYQREGTECENLPETHTFLKQLRQHVDQKFPDRILLAEANQWPEDAVIYFGQGDECHMAFYYPLMPRLFMSVRMEDRFPVIDILQQTPAIPENCQWGLFLRNHDELTLKIATDTERDYMYKVYASDSQARLNMGIRRRLAPLLQDDRRKIELMNSLLFSLPGTPIIYYGDEIGMGDNVYLPDRNGVRTPMQWSADRNAGFSQANPQRLHLPVVIDPEYHYQAINIETQQNNSQSLLWWMRRLIALRKHHPALSHGTLQFLYPDNHRVLAFWRSHQDETILVIANLSRSVQHVTLDLSNFERQTPVELFGRTEFPIIDEAPYLFILAPYGFYWLAIQPQPAEDAVMVVGPTITELPTLSVSDDWAELVKDGAKTRLEAVLPGYIAPRRWFGSKARTIRSTEISEAISIGDGAGYLVLMQVNYAEGEPETYILPLAFAAGERAERLLEERPAAVVARVQPQAGEPGVLFDAVWENRFCEALLETIAQQQQIKGQAGRLLASTTHVFAELRGEAEAVPSPSLLGAEQSNTSIRFGERLILKLFRKLEVGMNPDLEIGHFLTEKAAFANIPPVAGMLEYRRQRGASAKEPISLAILQGFVTNQGDAWSYTLDALGRYFERVLARPGPTAEETTLPQKSLLELTKDDIPEPVSETIGLFVESAQLLGQRTAELHMSLASDPKDSAFAPQSFTLAYQRPMHQGMRNLTGRIMQLLRQRLRSLPEGMRPEARQVLKLEEDILRRFHSLIERPISARRTRIHGDYHLGQVLYTGKDFMIIDFEGEPARSLAERRQKKSPLQDVAGMLRSFHYAAYAAFFDQIASGLVQGQEEADLEAWARFWHLWVSVAFLKTYLQVAEGAPFLPETATELEILLDAHLLEKAVYELGYELNNRPDWVKIPLQGILQTLKGKV